MPRKKREDPWSQGKLKYIANLFLGPILRMKPASSVLKSFLEQVFSIENREILKYQAKKSIKVPGLYVEVPNKPIEGSGYRRIKRGQKVWVRYDYRLPNIIELEFIGGKYNQSQWFKLNKFEWDSIKEDLRLMAKQ